MFQKRKKERKKESLENRRLGKYWSVTLLVLLHFSHNNSSSKSNTAEASLWWWALWSTYFLLRKVHVKFHRGTLVQGVESPEKTNGPRMRTVPGENTKIVTPNELSRNPFEQGCYVLTESASGLDIRPDPEGNSVCPWPKPNEQR